MTANLKLLELAERGPRVEAGSLANDRPPECPNCGCGASRDGKRLACCWCGCVTERSNGGFSVVDACRLFDGGWPE